MTNSKLNASIILFIIISRKLGVSATVLYINGLNRQVRESDLRERFVGYGTVVEVQVILDPRTRDPRGFGFVRMETAEAADRAIAGAHGKTFCGRTIYVERAKRTSARSPTPGRYYGNKRDDYTRDARAPLPPRRDDYRPAPMERRREYSPPPSGPPPRGYDRYPRRDYRNEAPYPARYPASASYDALPPRRRDLSPPPSGYGRPPMRGEPRGDYPPMPREPMPPRGYDRGYQGGPPPPPSASAPYAYDSRRAPPPPAPYNRDYPHPPPPPTRSYGDRPPMARSMDRMDRGYPASMNRMDRMERRPYPHDEPTMDYNRRGYPAPPPRSNYPQPPPPPPGPSKSGYDDAPQQQQQRRPPPPPPYNTDRNRSRSPLPRY